MNNNLTSKLLKIFSLYSIFSLFIEYKYGWPHRSDCSLFYEIQFFLCSGLVSVSGKAPFPLSFLQFWWAGSSVTKTDGRGRRLYMFRGQSHPTQQGSFSHQRLTSTSLSGHVQRQSFLSFLIFVLAASRCQHGSVKWLFEKITQIIILNRQSKKKSVILVFCFQKWSESDALRFFIVSQQLFWIFWAFFKPLQANLDSF